MASGRRGSEAPKEVAPTQNLYSTYADTDQRECSIAMSIIHQPTSAAKTPWAQACSYDIVAPCLGGGVPAADFHRRDGGGPI